MADNNGDLGSFLAGFMIGGLIGAGVALLMAPQSGEETRAYIKDKSIELRDQAAETAGEVQTRASDLAQQTAQAYEEQIQRLQAAVDASKKKPAKKTAEKAADESEAEASAEPGRVPPGRKFFEMENQLVRQKHCRFKVYESHETVEQYSPG